MKHDPITSTGPARAFVLFRSGGRLDLLNPHFDCWTDEDLALNLARISRWGGATRWYEPLSVAQHSLLVLQIREQDGSDAPRGAEGIAARRLRGPARLGSDRSAERPSRRAFSQARATAAGPCRRALRLAGVRPASRDGRRSRGTKPPSSRFARSSGATSLPARRKGYAPTALTARRPQDRSQHRRVRGRPARRDLHRNA